MRRDELIIGKRYKCYLNGKFIGIATFVIDENIGPSLIRKSIQRNGEELYEVFWPHEWEVIDG